MTRQKSPVRLDWLDPEVCSLDYRLKIIGRLPFFKHLPAAAIVKINGLFHDRDVATDEQVYFEGDDADNLYLVAMGKVKLMRHTGTGREVFLNILHGGEDFGTVGVFSGHKYTETAIAQTDCCILQISSADFESILADYPEVTRKVLGVVSLRLAESQEVVKQLITYPVEQRIAAALMRLAEGLGEIRGQDMLIQLPFSRQDLAAMIGATTETVSRVMSRFIEDGLIKSGRKWVLITDRKRLDEMAKSGAVN